jgi:preprotein translocase subunit SecF
MSGVLSRLYRGETTFNFVGRRWWGFGLSLFLIVVTMLSFFTRGLNLGIDFEGGVAWEVPAASLTVADVTEILEANGVDTADAKIQSLNGSDGPRIRVQVAEQSDATKSAVQGELAAMAKVDVQDVSVSSVSSSWGRSITEKAVRALLIFFVLV